MSKAVYVIVDWSDEESPVFVEIEDGQKRSVRIPCVERSDGLFSYGPLYYEVPE